MGLLTGAFRPLTFEVIIDIAGLIANKFVTVFYLLLFFVLIFVFHCFSSSCCFLSVNDIQEFGAVVCGLVTEYEKA